MSFRLVVLLYNLLLPGVFLLTAPFYLSKMARRGKARRHFGQRLGRYRDSIEPWLERQQGDPLWIHAVSVGEVLLALKLVKKLHEQNPQLPIALSCTTSTGFDVALSKYDSPHFHVLYRPIDFPIPVRGAFQALRPKALVLVESEIWPNTLSEAKRREVPVFLVNARLSPRSEKRFRKARALSRPLFEQLHQVQTQTEEDIERWANLGVPSDRLLHTGSIKFDQEALAPPEEQITAFRQILSKLRPPGDDGPILLAGSTHPGEEKLLAQAFETIREKIPRAFLILVPRHFERAQEVVAAVQSETTLHPLRKTEFSASTEIREPAPETCLLVDTTGELHAWYFLADLVFVGKTFLSEEGQNPVEPLLAGKPIVTGPKMKNFEPLFRRLKEAGGVLSITDSSDPEAIAQATANFLESPKKQEALVTNGAAVVKSDQGAARRSAQALWEEIR